MSSDKLLASIQDLRNMTRRQAWAERWRMKFGEYPPSCRVAPDGKRETWMYAVTDRASAARLSVCFASDLVACVHQERHGNGALRHMPRHKRQRIQAPPDVA